MVCDLRKQPKGTARVVEHSVELTIARMMGPSLRIMNASLIPLNRRPCRCAPYRNPPATSLSKRKAVFRFESAHRALDSSRVLTVHSTSGPLLRIVTLLCIRKCSRAHHNHADADTVAMPHLATSPVSALQLGSPRQCPLYVLVDYIQWQVLVGTRHS